MSATRVVWRGTSVAADVRRRHGPARLKLVDSTVSSTGVVIGTYEPAGEVVAGSFALE